MRNGLVLLIGVGILAVYLGGIYYYGCLLLGKTCGLVP